MNRSILLITSLCALALSGIGLVSCRPFIGVNPSYTPYDVLGVVPQTFLFTQYAQLNQFLDTPVNVQIDEVPLDQVFSHAALQPLNYRFSRKPLGKMPVVSVHQLALTRRQLLWCISKDYQLQMFPVIDPHSGTSYIEIRAQEDITRSKENDKASEKLKAARPVSTKDLIDLPSASAR